MTEHSKVSTEAVRQATGRGWDEWFDALDDAGAADLSHAEIVTVIRDNLELDASWWQQEIAVAYERARGMREVGQTASAGFEIGVQRTIPISPSDAWELMTTPPGRDTWLGSVGEIAWVPDAAYQTAEATTGKIRTVKVGERLRLTWQRPGWEQPSTLQVTLEPRAKGTAIRFHQEKLADADTREAMREHWVLVLERLSELHP